MKNILEQIDNYFEDKKPNEIALIGFMIIAIIYFLVYTYLFTPSEEYISTNKSKLFSITKKINNEKKYLKSITIDNNEEFYVKKLKKEMNKQKENLKDARYLNNYVNNKLKELSYLLFNDKNWSNFLDRISMLARKYDIKIIEISNEFNKPNFHKIEQILNVHVKTTGSYHGIMKFINSIEESTLIVDIYKIEIESEKNIHSDIDIVVWGMKY